MKELKGIDISLYQGNVNWDVLKSSGTVDFIILRAGYGRHASQKDKRFEEYYAECKKRNIPVGCYWFSYAKTAADAALEAKACYECIKGKKFEYPVFFDFEAECQRTADIANKVIPAFIDELSSRGYYVGLYSFKSLLDTIIPKSYQNKYDIWVAHWANSTSYKGHTMWQKSDRGSIPGIQGCVDIDVCYKLDYPTIMKTNGLNGFKKKTNNKGTSSTSEPKKEETTKPVEENVVSTSDNKNTIEAGMKIELNNTPIYSNASSNNSANKKTGTYYTYDNKIVSGKIRITNSIDNVGKTPVGNYVTGWISVSDISKNEEKEVTPAEKTLSAGDVIELKNTKLYSSSKDDNPVTRLTGEYYIYSTEESNGRIRITNEQSNVGKTPTGFYVTGWINKSDINN